MAKGFRDVQGGISSVAPILLPDSSAADFAIQQIMRGNALSQQQALKNQKAKQDLNKNFATNKLKIAPGMQYQNELSGLAQRWFNKGVDYKKQGFDPWNPDYSDETQTKASQEYLNEKQMLEDLSNFRKELDKDYNEKEKLAMSGKVEGWEDYQKKLSDTKLVDLFKAGGINSLPQLNQPLDLAEIDKSYNIAPRTREVEVPVPGVPGAVQRTTEKYVPVQDAAKTYEQIMLNTPSYRRKLQKDGIVPEKLFTTGGQNMIRSTDDPEDFGHIDEPAIFKQMVDGYLTEPELIKTLPSGVKKKIMDSFDNLSFDREAGGVLNTDKASKEIMTRYNPGEDPEFKKFVTDKFDKQIKKERDYQTEIVNGVMRKATGVPVGETTKIDGTLANLKNAQERIKMGWANNAISERNSALQREKFAEKTKDKNTRGKFVDDIQSLNPDAVKTFAAALTEVGAKLQPTKDGMVVEYPVMAPELDKKGVTTGQKEKRYIRYKIPKYSGRAGRVMIEQLLNKLPTFGKEKALTTEEYAPSYDDIGTSDTADDL